MIPSRREVIAYHEAGHAVVAFALGITIAGVWITDSGGGTNPDDDPPQSIESLWNHARVCAAGTLAATMAHGVRGALGGVKDVSYGCDLIREAIQLERVGEMPTDSDVWELYGEAEADALDIVEACSCAIGSVAERLAANGTLERAEFEQLVSGIKKGEAAEKLRRGDSTP